MLAPKPLLVRLEPVMVELSWVVAGCSGADQHQKILPEYRYQIFDLYRRTLLKVLAPLSEVVAVKDPERAATRLAALNALILVLAACRDSWNQLSNELSTTTGLLATVERRDVPIGCPRCSGNSMWSAAWRPICGIRLRQKRT